MSRRKGRPRREGRRSPAGRWMPSVDHGTPELQARRLRIVGENGDPALAATLAGALFARGLIDREQLDAADRYRALRCALYGAPWPPSGGASTDPASEARLARAQRQFDAMVEVLDLFQRRIVALVCVFDDWPGDGELGTLRAGLSALARLHASGRRRLIEVFPAAPLSPQETRPCLP